MDHGLAKAINSPADYTSDFTFKVSSLCARLHQVIGVECEHRSDMNYRAGQSIDLQFIIPPTLDDLSCANVKLTIFVSSKGPYYTYIFRRLASPAINFARIGLPQPKHVWSRAGSDVALALVHYTRIIDSIMSSDSYQRLDESKLGEIAEGQFARMDDAPATLFEVLFSEVE